MSNLIQRVRAAVTDSIKRGHIRYYENTQRIQREAVLEIIRTATASRRVAEDDFTGEPVLIWMPDASESILTALEIEATCTGKSVRIPYGDLPLTLLYSEARE